MTGAETTDQLRTLVRAWNELRHIQLAAGEDNGDVAMHLTELCLAFRRLILRE